MRHRVVGEVPECWVVLFMVPVWLYSGLMTDGPLRTVGIIARSHPLGRYGYVVPLIFIDGVSQLGEWNLRGQWLLPADRPVTVAVAQKKTASQQIFAPAEIVLPIGGNIELEYVAPGFWSARGLLRPRADQLPA